MGNKYNNNNMLYNINLYNTNKKKTLVTKEYSCQLFRLINYGNNIKHYYNNTRGILCCIRCIHNCSNN